MKNMHCFLGAFGLILATMTGCAVDANEPPAPTEPAQTNAPPADTSERRAEPAPDTKLTPQRMIGSEPGYCWTHPDACH